MWRSFINHSAKLTFINHQLCVRMLSQHDIELMCAARLCEAARGLAAPSPVYLYNSSVFKPWYLGGQVEVYCLMSPVWRTGGFVL